jgi:hypothetical protein
MLGLQVIHDRKVAHGPRNPVAAREQLLGHDTAEAAAHAGDEPVSLGHMSVLPSSDAGGQKRSPTRADQPFGDPRHLAILAVAAADLFGRDDEGGPDRGRHALGDRLELEGRPALGRQLDVDPLQVASSSPGSRCRSSSVKIPPRCSAVALTPRARWRRSNSTANRMLAVLDRP